jgi:hypothetical protein
LRKLKNIGGTKGRLGAADTKNEKKFKALEEKATDAMEMAAQTNEERKKEES